MRVNRLRLTNFRNIAKAELTFDKRFVLFLGDNAQGKTNLLEALYTVGFLRSFRTRISSHLIKEGEKSAVIEAEVEKFGNTYDVKIAVTSEEKRVWINGKPALKSEDYFGLLSVVLFTPDDLSVVGAGPSQRRDFLDRLIFASSPQYWKTMLDFKRAAKERSAALSRRDPRLLSAFNAGYAKLAARVITARNEAVTLVSPVAAETAARLSDKADSLELKYRCGARSDALKTTAENEEMMRLRLKEYEAKELETGCSLIGPGRDDMKIYVNGKDAANFASQGQKRTAALALKAAERMVVAEKLSDKPVMLLDDLSSELDLNRRGRLFSTLLADPDAQVFLTATEPALALLLPVGEAAAFKVKCGEASRMADLNDLKETL